MLVDAAERRRERALVHPVQFVESHRVRMCACEMPRSGDPPREGSPAPDPSAPFPRTRRIRRGVVRGQRGDRRDQRCIVVAHRIHARRHRMPRHRGGRERREQVGNVEIGGVEPARVVLRRDDHRHPLVHRPQQVVGRRRQDRAGVEHGAVGAPASARTGPRSRTARRPCIPMCTGCLPPGVDLPLVEAVGRNQAAVPAKGGAERRLLGDRLGARVDHLRADRRILGPARDESPAHLDAFARAVGALAHDRHLLHRRDVVARRASPAARASPNASAIAAGCVCSS